MAVQLNFPTHPAFRESFLGTLEYRKNVLRFYLTNMSLLMAL